MEYSINDQQKVYNNSISDLNSPMDIFKLKFADEDTKSKYVDHELPDDIESIFETALDCALSAGELITKYINDTVSKSQSIITKMSKQDFATQFDKRTENLIISKIKENFPSHEIIAEESTLEDDEFAFKDQVTWIIDPIDGTTNFLHGQNNVGICIGIKYKKKSILGIVYIPLWRELFFAVHGKGAYIMDLNNNNKIDRTHTNSKYGVISTRDDLTSAICLLESGYHRHEAHIKLFSNIVSELLCKYKVRGIRMFGCCSVHMCMIACGRGDIFFETGNLKPWDMVAGEVIVNEAGGYLSLANGDEFDCTKKQILCCQSRDTAELMVDLDILTQS